MHKFIVYKDENKETETVLETENMKTTMKQFTAGTFIAFLLLVGNVNAKGTEVKASSHESIETTLQLENWMTDETIWNTNSAKIAEFVQETETSMELENWMTREETWNLSNVNNETELKVEDWMINDNVWK